MLARACSSRPAKLHYFRGRGRSQLSRWALLVGIIIFARRRKIRVLAAIAAAAALVAGGVYYHRLRAALAALVTNNRDLAVQYHRLSAELATLTTTCRLLARYYHQMKAAVATLATANRALTIEAESVVRAQPLLGRVALVTGAGAGIGQGVAVALASAGAVLVLSDISQAAANETAAHCRAIGAKSVSVVVADVFDDEKAGRLIVEHAISQHGRLDCVVTNATCWSSRSLSARASLVEQDAKETMRSIEANQLGTLHTLQAAAEAMQLQEPLDGSESRGKMVIISSIMGQPMLSKQAASYSMSKAAISHLGACLASQLIDERINVNTVNTVCPGWLDASEADIARLGAQMPWRRLGKPSEIGKAVVFLCSEDATYITGSTLVVDGGYTVSNRLSCGGA